VQAFFNKLIFIVCSGTIRISTTNKGNSMKKESVMDSLSVLFNSARNFNAIAFELDISPQTVRVGWQDELTQEQMCTLVGRIIRAGKEPPLDILDGLARSKAKDRNAEKESMLEQLKKFGFDYETTNDGVHAVVCIKGRYIDIWPFLGYWSVRETGNRHKGVARLIRKCEELKEAK